MQTHRLSQCQVCSRYISTRFGGTCPSCRPELARSSARDAATEAHRAYSGPNLEEIFSKRVATKNNIPKAARRLWTQCLVQALAQIVEFNDDLAWAHFFMLRKAVLRSSFRGGKKKTRRAQEQRPNCCASVGWKVSVKCFGGRDAYQSGLIRSDLRKRSQRNLCKELRS